VDRLALAPLVSRWWWLLALATVIAGVAGYGAVTRAPKTYQSSVQVLVGPINTDVSLDASGALASTYADLAKSQSVLANAIKVTGSGLTTPELAKATTAISNQVTRIVTITVQNRDPARSAKLANAVAQRLGTLSTEVGTASASVLAAFHSQPEYQALERKTQNRVDRAASRVFGPSVAGRLTVIDPARVPTSAVKPVVPLVTLLSAVGGLLMGGIFVLLRESRTQRRRPMAPVAPHDPFEPAPPPKPRQTA
jgi:capsular polysaccharide biosynthesis protein